MPLFDYRCPSGHVTERLRRYDDRDDSCICSCGLAMTRQVSLPHCVPDGMYSYAPNLGDATAFERRLEAQKSGQKIINKSAPIPGAKFYG